MPEDLKWLRVFHKQLEDPTRWTKVCDLPSDTVQWRMYLIGVNGKAPADAYVKIGHEEEPTEDDWYPLFAATGNPEWNIAHPKAIYAQPFLVGGPLIASIVVVEVWTSKMPSKVGDKEKSNLGKIGNRQE
jgi:hypothetical protein